MTKELQQFYVEFLFSQDMMKAWLLLNILTDNNHEISPTALEVARKTRRNVDTQIDRLDEMTIIRFQTKLMHIGNDLEAPIPLNGRVWEYGVRRDCAARFIPEVDFLIQKLY